MPLQLKKVKKSFLPFRTEQFHAAGFVSAQQKNFFFFSDEWVVGEAKRDKHPTDERGRVNVKSNYTSVFRIKLTTTGL